jgi:hypothetical protein
MLHGKASFIYVSTMTFMCLTIHFPPAREHITRAPSCGTPCTHSHCFVADMHCAQAFLLTELPPGCSWRDHSNSFAHITWRVLHCTNLQIHLPLFLIHPPLFRPKRTPTSALAGQWSSVISCFAPQQSWLVLQAFHERFLWLQSSSAAGQG